MRIKETEWMGDQRKNWNHPDHSSSKINKDSKKILGNLRISAVTKTSVQNHLLDLMQKTHKEWNNNYNKSM